MNSPNENGNDKTAAPDPFDVASLAIPTNYDAVKVTKRLLKVPVTKPGKHQWFRVRPASEFSLTTLILDYDRQFYLVAATLRPELEGDESVGVRPMDLRLCVDRQHNVFVWPLRIPGPDGRTDGWMTSSLKVAEIAETDWARLAPNHAMGCYDVLTASAKLGEPRWPDLKPNDIVRLAFQDRLIDSYDHPILLQIRGEA